MTLPPVFRRRRSDNAIPAGDLAFLVREPAEVYHAQGKRFLSSHQLADFRRDPLLFRKKELGLVKEEDRPAYLIGRAAHTLILEGRETYRNQYAFGGPVNPKTGEPFGSRTKAFQEWAEAQGKPVLSDEQVALIESMNAGVYSHEHAAAFLSDGVAEGVLRAEYCDVACQARFDWFNAKRGIVDLKTCDNLDWLQSDARNYGYAHQMAFYRSILACVTGLIFPVHLVAVEKREPFRCGVWRMSEEVLGIAQRENEEAIERLKECRERNQWPTGYEDIRIFDWI
jgi:hypothetical protein